MGKTYRINEIFYSIQGEGGHAGHPAVFIRFSGCNLHCKWCDTQHENGTMYTGVELERAVEALIPHGEKTQVLIVFTGGEPTLQLTDDEELLKGYYRCIETNGTLPIPHWIDWCTVSPKTDIDVTARHPDELKLVFEPERTDYILSLEKLSCRKYLQPLERNGRMNIPETVDFILRHPAFKLSLQIHKLIGVR